MSFTIGRGRYARAVYPIRKPAAATQAVVNVYPSSAVVALVENADNSAFVPLLDQAGGSPIQIDIAGLFEDGNRITGSFAFSVYGTSGGGSDNVIFRVVLTTTSGTTVLGYGGGNFGFNFVAGGAIDFDTGAIAKEAIMVLSVEWRISFEQATAAVNPAAGDFPSSARLSAEQVKL